MKKRPSFGASTSLTVSGPLVMVVAGRRLERGELGEREGERGRERELLYCNIMTPFLLRPFLLAAASENESLLKEILSSTVSTMEATDCSLSVKMDAPALQAKEPLVQAALAICVANLQWSEPKAGTDTTIIRCPLSCRLVNL